MNFISSLTPDRRRWASLFVVCLAQLMIVLDVTIVNVALPSIQDDLGFSQANLTWVVNAFLVTFGSLLLLAGRLGDLAGRKRVFLGGVVTFTVASLLCGIAPTEGVLIAARFLQGIGAAAQASVILAIIITEFPEVGDRARAMGAYVFVSVAGGSLGLLAGGVLTEALSWHWVFFVNIPIGLATFALGQVLIRSDSGLGFAHGVDWFGSLLVTASLMSGIYAIVQVPTHGWLSAPVLEIGALSVLLMAAFISVEARISNPIMPLRILRLPGLINASLVRGFLVTGMYSTFFLGTLYLEQVRHFSPVETGAAFLPWTLTVAVLSQGITARLVARFGPLPVLTSGMGTAIVGLLLFSSVGPDTAFFPTIFFACLRTRARDRHRVHATADDRHGRRSRRGRRARIRHHQRFPADQRRARPCRAQHARRQPHEGAGGGPPRSDQLPDRRLPARIHHRGGSDRDRYRPRARAAAAGHAGAGPQPRRARHRPRHPRPQPGATSSMTPITTLRPARRRHAPDYSDAVVAAYIHDISTRTRHPRRAKRPIGRAEDRGPAYRLRSRAC